MKPVLLSGCFIFMSLGLSACVKDNNNQTNSSYANYPYKQVNPQYRQNTRTQNQNAYPCYVNDPNNPCDNRPLFDPSLPPDVGPNIEPAQGG